MTLPKSLVTAPASEIAAWNGGRYCLEYLFFEACWPDDLGQGMIDWQRLRRYNTWREEARGAFASTEGLLDNWGVKDLARFQDWLPNWVDAVRCITYRSQDHV